MSLSRRLFVLGGLTLLPVVAVQIVNEVDLRRTREVEIARAVARGVDDIARGQERLIGGVRLMLTALSESAPVVSEDPAACNRTMAALLPVDTVFQVLGAARADGTVFCTADRAEVADPFLPVADRLYFREAMATGAFTVGTHAIGRRSGVHVLHLAMPYRDAAGRPAGVVFAGLSLARLAAELDGPAWSAERSLTILDRDGTILVRLPDHDRFVGRSLPPEDWPTMRAATAPGTLERVSPLDGVRRIVGYVPPSVAEGGMSYAVGVARHSAFRTLDAATMRAASGILAAVAAALVLAWLFGRHMIERPVARLVALTQRWRAGDLAARSGMRGRSEFDQIGAAFDAMADDLVRSFEYKDVLLRELNHRIMNSLQTVSSLFRLQARTMRDPDARREFDRAVGRIASMALAYRRMHATGALDSVDFTTFLAELCDELARSLLPPGRACRVEADPLVLGPDRAVSLALIVNELVTNAIKHGTGDVAVRLERDEPDCRLTVRNGGRPEPEPGGHQPSGFGMQMVAATVSRLDGRLERSVDADGTTFTVEFPPDLPQPPDLRLVAGRAESA